jgi:hypothetical protein
LGAGGLFKSAAFLSVGALAAASFGTSFGISCGGTRLLTNRPEADDWAITGPNDRMQINIQTTTGRITDIKEDLFIGYSPGIL